MGTLPYNHSIATGEAWSWVGRYGTGEEQWKFEAMMIGVYFVLGAFLLRAVRDGISNSKSLISFTTWSHLVHALIMAILSVIDIEYEWRHLVPPGDVPALLLLFAGNAFLYHKTYDNLGLCIKSPSNLQPSFWERIFGYWIGLNGVACICVGILLWVLRWGWTWRAGQNDMTEIDGQWVYTGTKWSWNDWYGSGEEQWKFEVMIVGFYLVLGYFLLKAFREGIRSHKSLILFATWSHFVHAMIMLVEAIVDIKYEWQHLIPPSDIPALLLLFSGNAFLYYKAAPRVWMPSTESDPKLDAPNV